VRSLRARLIAPVLLSVLAFAPVASARDQDPNDLERARALFDEAGELERQGNWTAAQDRLREALRFRETPHLRYALGWALENGGRLLEARTEYEVALRLAQRGGVDEVSRLAATRIAEVDHKIPLVQIKVRGALAKDTRVLVDGREVIVHGEIGTVPVDPGQRVVRVERSGKSPSEETVAVTQGVFRVVEVPGDENAVLGGDSPSSSAQRSHAPVLPWALIGAGGAAVIGGVVLFVASSSDVSARDTNMRQWCDATACIGTTATLPETAAAAAYRREAYDAASRGNTKQVVGAIVGGVGIASIALGAYMLVKHGGERPDAPRAAPNAFRVDAAPLPGGAMAGAALTF
jgi:tetratricopeptide (TPR) repeat protein